MIESLPMKYLSLVLALSLCLFLSACSFISNPLDETKFYILQEPAHMTNNATFSENDVRIGLLPVSIPNYLKRQQIVLRENHNASVVIDDYNRWAEGLDLAIARVMPLALNNEFSKSSLSDRNVLEIRMGISVDEKLSIEILAFEGDLNKSATLKAHWFIQTKDDHLIENIFEKSLPVGNNYDSLVATLSTLLEEMAKSIVSDYSKYVK